MVIEYLLSLISVYVLVAAAGVVHVLLYKRDSRSAFGWIGLIVLFPIAGAVLYALFGINRVRRKARRVSLRIEPEGGRRVGDPPPFDGASMSRVGYGMGHGELRPGNTVETLFNGEEAFPAMLEAIEAAQREVLLSSYIFDNDETGRRFTRTLAAARDRGVTVRVLVDDAGIRYSFPTIVREFRRLGLPYRRFMPFRLIPPSFSINLRTHRKILTVDREVAFAGGMNIGDRQLVQGPSPHRASDLHFRFEGPVVRDLAALFEEDWCFSGGESLPRPDVSSAAGGGARCRLIADGPDETLDSMLLVYMGVIAAARRRVWVMTPYFLPERQFMGVLQAAALSGVDVQVMIPEKNNWPVVQWALQHTLSELLDTGVRVLRQPAPFAHSKCMIIDDDYVMLGSSNLDPRSLRLNFELGVEVFEYQLNAELAAHFRTLARDCTPFTHAELAARGTPARLRDAAAALFGPYL